MFTVSAVVDLDCDHILAPASVTFPPYPPPYTHTVEWLNVLDIYAHDDPEQALREQLERIRALDVPTLVLVEEIESLCTSSARTDSSASARVSAKLSWQLQRHFDLLEERGHVRPPCLLIATCTQPADVEPSLLRFVGA